MKKSEQIRELVCSGELDAPANTRDMLEQAGRLLDKSCSHEIVGEVLFRAEDKKWYVGTVEFVIGRANGVYARDTLLESGAAYCKKCDVVITQDTMCPVCRAECKPLTKADVEELVWQPAPKPKNRTSR